MASFLVLVLLTFSVWGYASISEENEAQVSDVIAMLKPSSYVDDSLVPDAVPREQPLVTPKAITPSSSASPGKELVDTRPSQVTNQTQTKKSAAPSPTRTQTQAPPASNCHQAYSDPCLPITDDLNCSDDAISRMVTLRDASIDPYGLDGDGNGTGCESKG